MVTVPNNTPTEQPNDIDSRMRAIEHFHRSRVEEAVRLTARVQLLEQLVIDVAEAHESNRLDQLAELIDVYRRARDYTGDPNFTTLDGERHSLAQSGRRTIPPPLRRVPTLEELVTRVRSAPK